MVYRNLMIAVAISVIVFMGFVFVTNMTGNAVTGSVVGDEPVVKEEYFKIDDFGAGDDLNNSNESEVEDDESR